MKKTILLVGRDLEPFLDLPGQLPGAGDDWNVSFARSGAEAKGLFDQRRFDAIIADLGLPDMDGGQLLNDIKEDYPQSLRFIYAALSTDPSKLKLVGSAHHLLSKPANMLRVKSALERAFAFQAWLPGEAVHGLISNLQLLPSPPGIYFQVVKELQSPLASIETVGNLISRDPAMTAKLLHLSNSAALGLQQQVTDATTAVMYLGVETTKSLILLAHTFSYFDQLKSSSFSIDTLWQHCLATGQRAKWIAKSERMPQDIQEKVYTAGLLHDLGKMVLAANLAKPFGLAYQLAKEKKVPLIQMEREILGASHAEVGAALLGIWGLPAEILESVAFHHTPSKCANQEFTPLTLVHVANVFAHEAQPDTMGQFPSELDMEYLTALNVADKIDQWRDYCLNQ